MLGKISLPSRRFLRYRTAKRRCCDFFRSSYSEQSDQGAFNAVLSNLETLNSHLNQELVRDLSQNYLSHEFKILGSSLTKVERDSNKGWKYFLDSEISSINRKTSEKMLELIETPYELIDWHVDFKSGYRWNPLTYFCSIRYGTQKGVDVKIPWELARFQHAPILAWAFHLASSDAPRFESPRVYQKEFQNQVLDFLSFNPPRYGVNWYCTMDVAIRAVNLLIAYDAFVAAGARFPVVFEKIFLNSMIDHAQHCANNLEYSQSHSNNHYLSNVCGLLIISSYLPSTESGDAWLLFGIHQLCEEFLKQFYREGSNFEASTSYHRLSLEMTLLAAAYALAIPQERKIKLSKMKFDPTQFSPKINFSSDFQFNLEDNLIFSNEFWERLERAVGFEVKTSSASRKVFQIGDNDSGRFIKIAPEDHIDELASDIASYESGLDHRGVVAAGNSFFNREGFAQFAGDRAFESEFFGKIIANSDYQPSASLKDLKNSCPTRNCDNGWRLLGEYREFGLFHYVQDDVDVSIRCGPVGQNGSGGHSHNDGLSVLLSAGAVDFTVDPGSYVYTSDPEIRNLFRSSKYHSGLSFDGIEPNEWKDGLRGLFGVKDNSKPTVVECSDSRYVGFHDGYGERYTRSVEFDKSEIIVTDECDRSGLRTVGFVCHPEVRVKEADSEAEKWLINSGKSIKIVSMTEGATFAIEEVNYSPAYGVIVPTKRLCLVSSSTRVAWKFQLGSFD